MSVSTAPNINFNMTDCGYIKLTATGAVSNAVPHERITHVK